MSELQIRQTKKGVILTFKIVPGSSKTAVSGSYGEMIKVKIAAPAEKGKANKALVKFLAEKLSLSKNDIRILKGETNPVKQIRINGVSKEKLKEKLLGK